MDCHEIDLIDYLKGSPNPSQTQAVLDHLDECARCRERLQVMVALEAGSNNRSLMGWRGFLMVAAGIFLVVLVNVLYPVYFGSPDHASLATNAPYLEFPLEVRDGGDSLQTQQAMELYRAGLYEEAAQHFERLSAESSRLVFYAGVSHYLAGRYNQAIEHLNSSSIDPSWREPSLWYLANAYLHLEKLQRAEEIILQLRKLDGQYSEEAAQLLDQLERLVPEEGIIR